MGLFQRFKRAFSRSPAADSHPVDAYTDPLEEQMRKEHAERQQTVIDQVTSELAGEDQRAEQEHIADAPADYDVGAVEIAELFEPEAQKSNHSLLNVVEHASVEDLGDHLESAVVLGDIPKEVDL